MANTRDVQARSEYFPDAVSCPGETLEETLRDRGMTQVELSGRIGRTPKTVNEIINGKAPITPETALQLERVLGIPATFWNNRERKYREWLAHIDERARLEKQVAWLDRIPVKTMIKYGWLDKQGDKVEQLKVVLNFFGVTSPSAWEEVWLNSEHAVFRKSATVQTDQESAAVWLRRGQLIAHGLNCQPFDKTEFKSALTRIRSLTLADPEVFVPALTETCATCGVAVAFVPELPKTGISAATWWWPDKAVIQLSLRYKRSDQLWFSFFHEAGHILLHGKRDVFLEVKNTDGEREKEADDFAANMLIPRRDYEGFVGRGEFSNIDIIDFAGVQGITPGIVVGRLQHDQLISFKHGNDLKVKLTWSR